MRPLAIIQARMGSTRLPGKVLKPILGRPMLWHIVQRVRRVRGLGEVVVATSDQSGDEPIQRFCRDNRLPCFAGSEKDVLDRFYHAAVQFAGDPIIRITGDCPFVDPGLIEKLLDLYGKGSYDHVSVATGAGTFHLESGRYPDGLDAECFSFEALEFAWKEAIEPSDREHVTPYIWHGPDRFRVGMVQAEGDYSHLRWTVDNEIDFQMVSQIYEALYREGESFQMADILNYLALNPELARMNQRFIGEEEYRGLWDPVEKEGPA